MRATGDRLLIPAGRCSRCGPQTLKEMDGEVSMRKCNNTWVLGIAADLLLLSIQRLGLDFETAVCTRQVAANLWQIPFCHAGSSAEKPMKRMSSTELVFHKACRIHFVVCKMDAFKSQALAQPPWLVRPWGRCIRCFLQIRLNQIQAVCLTACQVQIWFFGNNSTAPAHIALKWSFSTVRMVQVDPYPCVWWQQHSSYKEQLSSS